MSVIHPRNRLVNFRLSEVEFEQLRQASIRAGARSLSEFARNSVLRSLEEFTLAGGSARGRLAALDRRVAELEMAVGSLLRLFGAGRLSPVARELAFACGGSSVALDPASAEEREPGR